MATIKSYTDLEQSKKLAEILPLESADYYHATGAGIVITTSYITYFGKERCIPAYDGAVPCWSLVALFSVLPNGIVMNKDSQNGKYHCSSSYIGTYVTADNPVDACYKMILKLNELNLLL